MHDAIKKILLTVPETETRWLVPSGTGGLYSFDLRERVGEIKPLAFIRRTYLLNNRYVFPPVAPPAIGDSVRVEGIEGLVTSIEPLTEGYAVHCWVAE